MSSDSYSVGDRYMDHAGYRPPTSIPVPVTKNKRCSSRHPDYEPVRCIHLESSAHRTHTGWLDEVRLTWEDAPTGPRTQDEWEAIAWSFTDGLGIEIIYDPGDICLRLKHDSVAKWWDEYKQKEELLANYRAHRDDKT